METAAEHLAAEPAMAFTCRELASCYDKRDFPLDKVLVVKSVFPCAEVVEYRSLRPRRRAPSWGKTFTREVPEDG
jgi:hypothetical protein